MNYFFAAGKIVLALVEALAILLFYTILNDKKNFFIKYWAKSCFFILLYVIFMYWVNSIITPGIHTLAIVVFLSAVLSFITRTNFYTSLLTAALAAIFFTLSEIIPIVISISFFKVDLSTIKSNPTFELYVSAACKLIQISIVYALYRTNTSIFKSSMRKSETLFPSFVVFQITLVTIYTIAAFQKADVLVNNVLLLAMFLFSVPLAFIEIKEREQMLTLQHKFQVQEEYVKNLETMMSIIRKEKHDYANHLNTLLAMCLLNQPDSVQKIELYIRKLTNNLTSSYRTFSTGNDYVDGLLAVKSNFAFEHGIHFEVDFEAPLSSIEIDDIHITSIIGNIVDNAFDAILSLPYPSGKVVSLLTYIEKGRFCLSISDNGPRILEKDIDRIFEKGFSTKPNTNQSNGFGLYIVKQLVVQSHGTITVSSTEEETEFLMYFEIKQNPVSSGQLLEGEIA